MAETAVIFLTVAALPFFRWQQKYEGRNYAAFFVSGALLLWWLVFGIPVALDSITTLALCFALWLIASIFWSNSRQSSFDLYLMLSGLAVFLAARVVDTATVMIFVLLPGLIFAGVSLFNYGRPYRNNKDWMWRYCIFGNQNHLGCFYLMPLFSSLWLSFNISPWFFPASVFMAVAIALSECRGAQIGAVAGLIVFGMIGCSPWFGLLFILMGVLAFIYGRMRPESNWHRVKIWLAAFFLIKRHPLTGTGLRTFRRELAGVLPELITHPLAGKLFARDIENATSHRVHNDHLELIVELGVVGYIIFAIFFSSFPWQMNALLSGAFVAFAVHGLFFFPLREAHTALPFWAVMGAMIPAVTVPFSLNPYVAAVLALIALRLMYGMAVKCLGLHWYNESVKADVAANPQTPEECQILKNKQECLNRAIMHDPYNNDYLTEGYYYNVFDNPELAFQYASRCVENFDGGKVRWGVMDQYARALLRLGGFGVAKMALKYALHICPGFIQSISLMKQIDDMQKAGGVKNGL